MNKQSTGNKIAMLSLFIALLSLFTGIAAIVVGAIFAIAPQEIKCAVGLLPDTCRGVYFVSDSAYLNVELADQRAIKLKELGYSDAGHFFIPDYPNLSGKHLYAVYAGKFENRDDCASFLEKFSQMNAEAYCVRASTNSSVKPDRFCVKSFNPKCSYPDGKRK